MGGYMKKEFLYNEKGFVTLIALLMVGMLTLIGLAVLSTSDDEVTIAGNELQEMRAFYAAEAGLDKAAAEILYQYENTGVPPTVLPTGTEEINQCQVAYVTSDDGPATQRVLTTGSLIGLHALVKTFSINSTSQNINDNAKILISQSFETALVPIFQFAVFYNDELWAQPVFDMNLDGRVHSNGDMYVQSSGAGKTLLFEDKVTCSGNINHGFPWGTTGGDVKFTDANGNNVSMNQGGNWIDSKYAHQYLSYDTWYQAATALWGGEVQDKTFGQQELNLPISNSDDPHKIIERSDGGNTDSYESKASFKIIDGVPFSESGGVWTNVSALLPLGTITCDASVEFYDGKEKKTVQNTQIDIGLLQSSGYFPNNGVLYVSDQRSSLKMNGTSLVNGTDVGAPLTLATENPLYIHGDFNTVDKQPVATMSDAITFLSNNWDPAKSSLSFDQRIPTPTTANISFLSGDVEADVTAHNYEGGLENLPRFLEDWNGQEMKIRGSMIQMWRSVYATADWRYVAYDQYYTAPSRNWGFDTDLDDPNKLPPEAPTVRLFQRTGWQQQYVGYDY